MTAMELQRYASLNVKMEDGAYSQAIASACLTLMVIAVNM